MSSAVLFVRIIFFVPTWLHLPKCSLVPRLGGPTSGSLALALASLTVFDWKTNLSSNLNLKGNLWNVHAPAGIYNMTHDSVISDVTR